MKDNITITVVTVTYNALDALRRTMASVEAQNYHDIDYIVVDGASTDGTPDFLETCHSESLRWVSEPDGGIYDAMNKGIVMAKGGYCIFMNAGDVFVGPSVVSSVVAQMTGEEDVVYGDIMKNSQRIVAREPRNCHRMYYCHQSAFVRTDSLRAFPFDVKHRMSADFKQAKQLFLAGKRFRHVDLLVADFDTTGVSNTRRSDGLWDNITVIWEVDGLADKAKLLPRILFSYIMCKLRGK